MATICISLETRDARVPLASWVARLKGGSHTWRGAVAYVVRNEKARDVPGLSRFYGGR